MINFYRRAMPHVADSQRRLQVLIRSNKKNDKTPLQWTDDATEAFDDFKIALSNATPL